MRLTAIIQALQDVVPRLCHALQFVAGLGNGNALREILHSDGAGDGGDFIDRPQGAGAEPVSAKAGDDQDAGNHPKKKVAEVLHDAEDFIERHGDLGFVDGAGGWMRKWQSELAAVDPCGDTARCVSRRRRQAGGLAWEARELRMPRATAPGCRPGISRTNSASSCWSWARSRISASAPRAVSRPLNALCEARVDAGDQALAGARSTCRGRRWHRPSSSAAAYQAVRR